MTKIKTRYEYIHFSELPAPERKTKVWTCATNSERIGLGGVRWYGAWRQYCYFPFQYAGEFVYSEGCLKDIAEFLGAVNKQHRENRKLKKESE